MRNLPWGDHGATRGCGSQHATDLHVLCSPFKLQAVPGHDASKVRASGPGLSPTGVPASLPVEFTIDARDAGEGLLTVQILVSTHGTC